MSIRKWFFKMKASLTENTAPAVRAGLESVWAENISVTKLNWPQYKGTLKKITKKSVENSTIRGGPDWVTFHTFKN